MPFEKLPPELRDKVQSISIVFIFSGADIALIPEWIQNWATCYGSKTIVKFDNNGKPLSPPEGYNFNGQLGLMQGIIVTPSGDVWALDLEKSQVVYLPKVIRPRGNCCFRVTASTRWKTRWCYRSTS
jgi:hypothetical protein